MLFDVQAIMALRPNGTPLHITVDNAAAFRCSLSAAGRGTFELSSFILIPDPVEAIHQAFSHYPDEVTVNGEEVKRTPFQDHASIRVAQAPHMDRSATTVEPLSLDGTPPLKKGLNTYAGGILSDLIRPHKPPKSYWTRLPSAQPHWSPCGLVFINPVYVITDQELDSLDTALFTAAYQGTMPEELKHLNDRAESQFHRTIDHPNAPKYRLDKPFHYIVGAQVYRDEARRLGAPILLHRKPAVFRDTMTPSSTLISAAQALYRTDAGIVPVLTAQNRPGLAPASHRKITGLRFETTPGQTNSQSPITAVEHITMQFHLEQDNNPSTVPAPFMMQGDDENEFQVQFVPHLTSPEDLEHHIIQAYRSYDDTIPKDLRQEELENLTARVKDLMEQAIPLFG